MPIRSSTELYVRVPPRGRLHFELETQRATLAVMLGGDGIDDAPLLADVQGGSGGKDVDLAAWSGRTVRLRFRAEPQPGGPGAAACAVSRLDLTGDDVVLGETLAAPKPVRRPNVILYVIDTVRADHLGCYGYPRPSTPRIDAFSTSAVRFTDAVAQSSWTLSSTASILTGLTPVHHGALADGVGIRPDVPTVAEAFHAAGYRTAAFVTNYLASAEFGDARGFDRFRLYEERPKKRRTIHLPSSALFRRVSRWVGRQGRTPFLLYVHATDPHWPYLPPPRYLRPFHPAAYHDPDVEKAINAAWPFFFGNARWGERRGAVPPEQLALLRDLYDGDLRVADDFFGRLIDLLGARGLLDDTVVVLTSDHGEEFQDHHGLAHGQTLYREVLHVPLLVRLPGGAAGGREVSTPVSHVDVAPTLLELAGVPVPPGLDGRSLLHPRSVPSEEAYSFLTLMGAALEAVTGTDWKVVHRLGEGKAAVRHPYEAYDRGADLDERHDRASDMPVLLGYARQRFDVFGAAPTQGPEPDPRAMERLRALGYVQD